MTGNRVIGSGKRPRAGAQTLALLAAPLNAPILRALAQGPKQQAELRRETGSPAQTTLRAQLKRLTEIGTIEKRRRNSFPGTLEYELTATGRELLFVTDVVERWLDSDPAGPQPLGSGTAKVAINALAEGWTATMLRALAAGPLSLTELDRMIGALSYPSLERRLATMRLAGQLEAQPSNGRGTPYAVTEYLREGVAPLAAAVRWERRHRGQATAPIGRIDVETAFLLSIPLLTLAPEISGTCCLAAELGRDPAGVTVEVVEGRIVSCSTDLQGNADSRALGPPIAWLAALIERDPSGLELSGDCAIATTLLKRLHKRLFTVSKKDHAKTLTRAVRSENMDRN